MGKKASIQRLKFCNFKLDVLLGITTKINQNPPVQELLDMYEELLRNKLNIGKIVLFQYRKKWDILLEAGLNDTTHGAINVKRDLSHFKEITPTSSANSPLLKEFDIIIPVYHENTAIAFVLIGDIEEEMAGISPTIKHVNFIQTVTNIIIVAIENKRLYNENLRQEAIRKELELASNVQNNLIPDKTLFPDNNSLVLDAYYRPHFEVGGDYYDYIPLNDNEFGFCIADVSGKGMSAALLMSNFQASLRALFTEDISMETLMRKLNELVWSNTKGDRFITIFIAKYNYNTQKLTFINGGHNPPLLYNRRRQHLLMLEQGCIGLGMLEEIPGVNVGELIIEPSSVLFSFTDGLAEIQNEEGYEIGNQIIQNTIRRNLSLNDMISRVISQLNINDFNKQIFDDIAIFGIDFKEQS